MLACMIALSSVWADRTYAYFNASNNASGTITMGTLKVNNFGELDADTSLKVVPNQTVTKNFKATIESDIKYYKRLSLSAEVKIADGKARTENCGDVVANNLSILNITVQNFDKYEADGTTYYYSLTPVTPTNTTTEENFTVNLSIRDWVGSGGCDYYMGATVNLNIKVEVIQADYLEDNGLANLNTFTTATALHAVWTTCCPIAYTVTISAGYGVMGLYYAKDEEIDTSYIGEYESITFTSNKIFLIFGWCCQGGTPDWSMEKDTITTIGTTLTPFVPEIQFDSLYKLYIDGEKVWTTNDESAPVMLMVEDEAWPIYGLLMEITQDTNILLTS